MCFEIVLDNAITGTQASDNKGMLDLLSTKTSAKTGMLNLRFKKATKDDIEVQILLDYRISGLRISCRVH